MPSPVPPRVDDSSPASMGIFPEKAGSISPVGGMMPIENELIFEERVLFGENENLDESNNSQSFIVANTPTSTSTRGSLQETPENNRLLKDIFEDVGSQLLHSDCYLNHVSDTQPINNGSSRK